MSNSVNDKVDKFDVFEFGILIVIFAFIIWLSVLGDVGQFIKFLWLDIIITNGVGFICLGLALFTLIVGSYLIIRKKAADPKRLSWLMPLVVVILGVLGILNMNTINNNLSDVISYLKGDIKEETVVIEKFNTSHSGEFFFYNYTFADGRQFSEKYQGKGFGKIIEGSTYSIRYLPKSKKLLHIERLE